MKSNTVKRIYWALIFVPLFAGCSPKVGSDAWCKKQEDKARGEWTMNETADFAKFCILRLRPEE